MVSISCECVCAGEEKTEEIEPSRVDRVHREAFSVGWRAGLRRVGAAAAAAIGRVFWAGRGEPPELTTDAGRAGRPHERLSLTFAASPLDMMITSYVPHCSKTVSPCGLYFTQVEQSAPVLSGGGSRVDTEQ
jgi:hypothetical protein